MNTRDETKSSILFEALNKVFDKKINKARVMLISLFIIALNQVRTVNFEKLAIAFNTSVKASKSSGYNLEDTHLTEADRIQKLFDYPYLQTFNLNYK